MTQFKSFRNFITLLLCLFGLYHLYPFYFQSLFDAMPGNQGDNRLNMALAEHWFQVLTLKAPLFSLNFFYPAKNTLFLGDGLFFVGLLHSLFRFVGFSIHSSYQLVTLSLPLIGLLFTFKICRQFLKMSFSFSLFAAALFAFSGNFAHQVLLIQMSATQLLAPFIYLLLKVLTNYQQKNKILKKDLIKSFVAGLFFPGFMLTSFYSAWFVLLLILVFVVILVCDFVLQKALKQKSVLTLFRVKSRNHIFYLGTYIFSSAMGLLFLVYKYAPVGRGRLREWADVEKTIPTMAAAIRPFSDSILWGRIVNSNFSSANMLPISYILFSVFLCASLALYIPKFRSIYKLESELQNYRFYQLLTFTLFAFWGLSIQFGDFTLWKFVFDWVPGAKAVRVVYRLQMVLIFFVTCSALKWLNDLYEKKKQTSVKITIFIILTLLAGETAFDGHGPIVWSKKQDQTIMKNIQSPPRECESFFVSTAYNRSFNWIYNQTLPMILTSKVGIPTINGYHGNFPDAWWGVHNIHNREKYLKSIREYLFYMKRYQYPGKEEVISGLGRTLRFLRSLVQGPFYFDRHKVCSLDVETGEWVKFNPGDWSSFPGADTQEFIQ